MVQPAIQHSLESRQPRCCRQDTAAVDAPEHYHVYVIELGGKDGAPTSPPSMYVGQSVHSPDARFAQRRQGYKAARGVKRAGLWLRWRLFAHLMETGRRISTERAPFCDQAEKAEFLDALPTAVTALVVTLRVSFDAALRRNDPFRGCHVTRPFSRDNMRNFAKRSEAMTSGDLVFHTQAHGAAETATDVADLLETAT